VTLSRVVRPLLLSASLVIAMMGLQCGGGGSSPPVPATITVALNPTSASVTTSGTQQFTATVAGTSNTAVTWSVNGVAGGDSTFGTVSTNGLYAAPCFVPSPNPVRVTATSKADASASGSATVTITTPPGVVVCISPAAALLPGGGTQQFTANVAVTWSVNGVPNGNASVGTIDSSGFYTAPSILSRPQANSPQPVTVTATQTTPNINIGPAVLALPHPNPVTITATSQADTSKSGSAHATITPLSFVAAGIGTSAGGTGVTVSRASAATLFLVGNGFVPGTSYAITGPSPNDITVIQPIAANFCQTTDTPPIPCARVSITVLPTAALGPRNIVVTNPAGELAVFPGGLLITP
jgi:hypothetical protein